MSSKEINELLVKIILISVSAILIVFTYQYLLIFFGAFVIANFISKISEILADKYKGKTNFYAAIIWIILIVLTVLFFILIGNKISEQFSSLLDQSIKNFQEVSQYFKNLEFIPQNFQNINWQSYVQSGLTMLTGFVALPTLLFLMIIISAVLTFEKKEIFEGFSSFLKSKTEKADVILKRMIKSSDSLFEWMKDRLISMAIVALLTTIALLIANLPFAIILGIIAGVLSFIPNLGPILSTAPALLIAFSQGWQMMLIVVLIYIGVQALESNLITPFIVKTGLNIPIVLTFLLQFIFSALFGILGLMFAVPLGMTLYFLVKEDS